MTDDLESNKKKSKNSNSQAEPEKGSDDSDELIEDTIHQSGDSDSKSPSSQVATALNLSRVDVDLNEVIMEDGQKRQEDKQLKEESAKKKAKEMTDTSSRLPKVDLKKLTIEPGANVNSVEKKVKKKKKKKNKGKSKKRLAKTMVEADMPSLDAIKNKIEEEHSKDNAKDKDESNRRVAKTMVEMEMPSSEAVKDKIEEDNVQTKSKSENLSTKKPVAKTLLENEIPTISSSSEDIATEESGIDDKDEKSERPVAKTMLDSELPDAAKLKEAIELAAKEGQIDESTENVAKTMLESDFPDLLRIHSLIENRESELEKKKSSQIVDSNEESALDKSEADQSFDNDQWRQKNELNNSDKLSKLQQVMSSGSLNVIPKMNKMTLNHLDRGILRSLSDVTRPNLNDEVSARDRYSNLEGKPDIGIVEESEPESVTDLNPESEASEETLVEMDAKPDLELEASVEPESEAIENTLVEANAESDLEPSIEADTDYFNQNSQELEAENKNNIDPEEKELSPEELFKKQLEELDVKAPRQEELDVKAPRQEELNVQAPRQEELNVQAPRQEELDVKAPRQEDFVARTMLDHELIIDTLSDSLARMEEKVKKDIAEKEQEPLVEKEYISDYQITKECPWVWDEADTKDRLRYCGKCDSVVYDFNELEKFQADSMIFQRENIDKYTLYKRPDGKFMTSDCPLAVKSNKNKTLIIVAGLVLVVMIMSSCITALMSGPKPSPSPKSAHSEASESIDNSSTSDTAVSSPSNNSSTTTKVRSDANSMPKVKKGEDGSYHYDIDDPSTYTYQNDGTTNNSRKDPNSQNKDYSNVPEASEKGDFWKYDGN